MSNPALAADVLAAPVVAVPDVSPFDCPFTERPGQHEIEKKADGSFWCELCGASAKNLEDLARATVQQLQAEEALRSGEASRSTERAPSETAPSPSWKAATEKLRALGKNSKAAETEPLLRELAASVQGQDAKLVDAVLEVVRTENGTAGSSFSLEDPEPWPEAVDGARLLADLESVVTRFVVVLESAATAVEIATQTTSAEIAPGESCLDPWIEARLRTSTSDPGPEAV